MSFFMRHIFTRVNKRKSLTIRLLVLSFFALSIYFLFNNYKALLNHKNDAQYSPLIEQHYLNLFQKLNPVIKDWGENGKPVFISDQEKEESDKLFPSAGFNVYISDRISPNRSLPDPRPLECSKLTYNLNTLGQASVVIIYTNEIWSALIRTIWSVVNRSPKILLKEIILVDDFSTRPELKKPLDEYINYYFGDLVKVIRLKKREGLIRARLVGARASQGDALIFLDSHCEATVGWLEPLMQALKEDYRNVVCPVIDVISDVDLQYLSGNPYYFQVGGFIWSGNFVWMDINEDDLRKNPTGLMKTATMAGGLFAINRKYFFDIGSYDEKMEIWGGENLELSFRLWQCGGALYISPCSHVGHIFRDFQPYSFLGKDTHGLNTLRTVLVWMDEYSRYFFLHRKDLKNKITEIDVSDRIQMKHDLKCKSFQWYLENVYSGKKFIYDQDVHAYGTIRNPFTNLCLDNMNKAEDSSHPIGVYNCLSLKLDEWSNQMFSYMINGEIRREEGCLTIDGHAKHKVFLFKCIDMDKISRSNKKKFRHKRKLQIWKHIKGGQIRNEQTNLCLSTAKNTGELRTAECNPNDFNQIWWFQKYVDINLKLLPAI